MPWSGEQPAGQERHERQRQQGESQRPDHGVEVERGGCIGDRIHAVAETWGCLYDRPRFSVSDACLAVYALSFGAAPEVPLGCLRQIEPGLGIWPVPVLASACNIDMRWLR